MFCPQCGKKSRENDVFCSECGTRLPVAAQPLQEKPVEQEPVIRACPGPLKDGAILTNLKALEKKLGVSTKVLRTLLCEYSDSSLDRGIRYSIVDASDYQPLNPSHSKKTVRLSPSDSWQDYAKLLADYYRFGRSTEMEESCYLFIIGGEDIVPMPCVPHYMAEHPDLSDKTIDTDLPYAYLLGERTYPMLKSGELFNYEQYFHVGRLPLPADAGFADLENYLSRAKKAFGGIRLANYFGQTNLDWAEDSIAVCEPLREGRLISQASDYERIYANYEDGTRLSVARDGLFFSPPASADRFFSKEADFYYFNLHGSDAPAYPGFLADYAGTVITPEYLGSVKTPNIIVTEACYGARFIGYDRGSSMLHAAMTGKTLLYLGSSRIAFCNNRYSIDNSDRLANVYIARLLEGYSAGEALFLARQSFFEYDNGRLYDQQMTTIVEFNLFGDPFLHTCSDEAGMTRSLGTRVITQKPVKTVSESKCIYKNGENAPKSLLDTVRGLVDRNLEMIRECVKRELYERMGIEPRQLSIVSKNRFQDGEEFYSFDYLKEDKGDRRIHFAIADATGKVKTVISTK